MEMAKMSKNNTSDHKINYDREEDREVMLPGFRFHPTDEELVGFYLRRKVDKKPLNVDIIKQIDIYKFDPWDLPKVGTVGETEGYFFCLRGRKYKNSVRPNRVTGSGFWKATGIDKPIYAAKEPHDCVGLKKSLVYYRGSAGKGTKTDWMMHEFRLPPNESKNTGFLSAAAHQEAEVWTLCRIFKRAPSHKKYMPAEWKRAATKQNPSTDSSSNTCSFDSAENSEQDYPGFGDSSVQETERKPLVDHFGGGRDFNHLSMTMTSQFSSAAHHQAPQTAIMQQNFGDPNEDDFFANGNWDELRTVVDLANVGPSDHQVYDCT